MRVVNRGRRDAAGTLAKGGPEPLGGGQPVSGGESVQDRPAMGWVSQTQCEIETPGNVTDMIWVYINCNHSGPNGYFFQTRVIYLVQKAK